MALATIRLHDWYISLAALSVWQCQQSLPVVSSPLALSRAARVVRALLVLFEAMR